MEFLRGHLLTSLLWSHARCWIGLRTQSAGGYKKKSSGSEEFVDFADKNGCINIGFIWGRPAQQILLDRIFCISFGVKQVSIAASLAAAEATPDSFEERAAVQREVESGVFCKILQIRLRPCIECY